MKKIVVIFFLLPLLCTSQGYFKDHFGGTIGLITNIGSHNRSVGVTINGYWTDYFVQINASSSIQFYSLSYGKRRNFWESRNAIGAILLAGKKERTPEFQLDGLNHNTTYNFGVGYNYVAYFNNSGTSQFSGGFAAHIKHLGIYHENDVFGGQAKDRFRTGHVLVTYQYRDYKFGLGVNLWTGETAHSNWQKINSDKMPNGFRILEELPYGKTSHGIVYTSFTYNLPYGQDAFLRIGADSENIRHAIQNRLMHDLLFIPKKLKRTTPHYPRLDKNGCPVFNKEDARPISYYFQFGTNINWSN